MARKPRIDFPGAFHHVMNRGADRQATFRTDADRRLFLQLWQEAASRFGIEIIAFCLMGNHFHFFVHSPDAQLSVTMQFVGRSYTQAFNERHGRDGALFRGRFHSVLVDSEVYFSKVARYIELNPVAAGLCDVKELAKYPWSSFPYNSGRMRAPSWLATRHLRDRFNSASDYEQYVLSGRPDHETTNFYRQKNVARQALGSSAFIEQVRAKCATKASGLVPGVAISPHKIDSVLMERCGVEPAVFVEPKRGRSHPARHVAIELSAALTRAPLGELANRYGYSSRQTFHKAVVRSARNNQIEPVNIELRRAVLEALNLP